MLHQTASLQVFSEGFALSNTVIIDNGLILTELHTNFAVILGLKVKRNLFVEFELQSRHGADYSLHNASGG